MLGLLEFDACVGRIFGVFGYGVAARSACDALNVWDGSDSLDTREERT